MPRRRSRLTQIEQRTLVTRAGSLQALSQHPSWPDLEAEVGRKRARIERHLIARSLGVRPVDQREVDYMRGFIGGMQWLAAVPQGAEATLERYFKEQGYPLEGAE